MDPAELQALNDTFATIERGINNLNARLRATMALVAALPGADRVDAGEIERRAAAAKLDPVLSAFDTTPEQFLHEAIEELRRMAAASSDLMRKANQGEQPVSTVRQFEPVPPPQRATGG